MNSHFKKWISNLANYFYDSFVKITFEDRSVEVDLQVKQIQQFSAELLRIYTFAFECNSIKMCKTFYFGTDNNHS